MKPGDFYPGKPENPSQVERSPLVMNFVDGIEQLRTYRRYSSVRALGLVVRREIAGDTSAAPANWIALKVRPMDAKETYPEREPIDMEKVTYGRQPQPEWLTFLEDYRD